VFVLLLSEMRTLFRVPGVAGFFFFFTFFFPFAFFAFAGGASPSLPLAFASIVTFPAAAAALSWPRFVRFDPLRDDCDDGVASLADGPPASTLQSASSVNMPPASAAPSLSTAVAAFRFRFAFTFFTFFAFFFGAGFFDLSSAAAVLARSCA
jgi:hypothetical protein